MLSVTEKQRDTFLKIVLNASNGVLGGVVLSSVFGQHFRLLTFSIGLGLYIGLVILALSLSR